MKTNKAHFFWKSVLKKQIPAFKENDEEIVKAIKEFRSHFPELQFKEKEFPFLHKAQYKDVLSPFFNLKDEPPNLVFIIVEGLSYDILYNKSLMPFLDSLSAKSLSWEYCLSVASRTFGVFPALFGSAPLGEKGFMDQCPGNIEHHSLPRILNKNGYTNHFFYGGWMGFDNMATFAKINKMNHFKKEDWEQDIKDETIGSVWGYEDHLTYTQALRALNNVKSSPRLDVYLSLTTHDPFEYPNRAYFQGIVKSLSQEHAKYTKTYGSFLYSDGAIQQLMDGYKTKDDYDNTIFIITGDHSSFAKQFGGYENYHVPLIIYSPMLKSGRTMKGVASHRDMTPTLLSLLKNNYNIETPSEVTWLNTPLDTSLTFNANTFSPLQIIDRSISGVLYKNYMLCEGILEEITDGAPRKINNPDVLQQMNRLQSLYQSLDQYILNNNALIRNYYAHRHQSKNIIHIEDTISQESYYAKKSKLKVVEGPEGHKTTLYFDSSNNHPIEFLRFDIPDDMEEFRVEIEFMVYIINETDAKKYVTVTTTLMNVSSKTDYLKIDKHNRWHTYKRTVSYKKELWEDLKGKRYLKIFLGNNSDLEGYIDDIKVKVTEN